MISTFLIGHLTANAKVATVLDRSQPPSFDKVESEWRQKKRVEKSTFKKPQKPFDFLIDMVWLYCSTIPVGRRGYFNYFYLPSLRLGWGGGGSAPCAMNPLTFPFQREYNLAFPFIRRYWYFSINVHIEMRIMWAEALGNIDK
jgi:hypothetical protein